MDEKFRVQVNKNTSVNIAAFLNLFIITSIEITCVVQNHKVIRLTIKGICYLFMKINKALNYFFFIELDIHSFNYRTGISTKLNTEIFMIRCYPCFKSSRFRPCMLPTKKVILIKKIMAF